MSKMSAHYARDHCKIAVAKVLQTIGWHSINSTPLEVLTDILARYIHQISEITNDYATEFGQTEVTLDHLGLAFQELGINLTELEEYVTYVNFAPGPAPVPKFPIPKENNLNFLKPGSKEVVTRPVYIHEHLPPMYPLLEGGGSETENMAIKQEITEEETPDGAQQFKKPADVSSPEFKRPKREEEGSRPTREISSVMMTTSGFLSPAREGKLPEARTPVPPQVPETAAPVSTSPNDSGRKKVEKKRERIGKELFKPVSEEKVAKKTPTMKDVVKMKQMKAAAAAANTIAANSAPNVAPPLNVASNEVKIMPIPQHKLSQKQNFNKDLAAAKAKTEKFNTTITPIPMKPRSPHLPPTPMSQVDKLFTEPDKKKVNIFKKISNVKEKHETKAKKDVRTNLMMNEASPVDIVNKITHLSSDITIEPIMNPVPVSRSPDKLDNYFDHNSPIGTPSTPKTPEIITPSPPLPKEKRKRKEGTQKRKRVKKNPSLLETDIIDITMERPKTPEAHLVPPHMRHQPSPNLLSSTLPYSFLRYSGPGLIPNQLADPLPILPFPYMSDFGMNPYFPPISPNMPPQNKPPPTPKIKEHEEKPFMVIPPMSTPQPISVEEPTPSISAPSEVKDKKTKDHKKEKKDKIKKKNKKDKVKEKSEKKKLKELKKDNREKVKKEKKEKKVKEKEIREGESPIPKILLKVNSPSPRPETPESTRKLNIKPIVKKDQELPLEDRKRDSSPVGLAKISALVTGPPKPKTSTLSPVTPAAERTVTDEAPPVPVPRTPGRPRLHPVKPKPPPKPKKIEQTFKKTDEHGNEVWICPACGQQDDGRPMIGCDGCDAWYHWVCVGIQVPPDENENWYCKPCLCRKNEDLQSDKKRKRKKKDKKDH